MSELVDNVAKIINPVAFYESHSFGPVRDAWQSGARTKAREIISEIRNGADDAMLRAGFVAFKDLGTENRTGYDGDLTRIENIFVAILDEALR